MPHDANDNPVQQVGWECCNACCALLLMRPRSTLRILQRRDWLVGVTACGTGSTGCGATSGHAEDRGPAA